MLMDSAAKPNTSWLQWLPFDTTRLQRLGALASDGVAPLGAGYRDLETPESMLSHFFVSLPAALSWLGPRFLLCLSHAVVDCCQGPCRHQSRRRWPWLLLVQASLLHLRSHFLMHHQTWYCFATKLGLLSTIPCQPHNTSKVECHNQY